MPETGIGTDRPGRAGDHVDCLPLSIPLETEARYGVNWGEMTV